MKIMVIRVELDGEDTFFLPLDQEVSWWVKSDGDKDYTKVEIESPIDTEEKLDLFGEYLTWHTALEYSSVWAKCSIDWIDIRDPDDMVICDELNLNLYKERAYEREYYNTPFSENPKDMFFSCHIAEDGYRGELYSKDFGWFDCPDCGRTICEQNPNDGWMVQYRWMDSERVCNRCYKNHTLANGMELGEDDSIPGVFGTTNGELESYGYRINEKFYFYGIGSGWGETYDDNYIEKLIDHLHKLTDDGTKWFIVYEDMAIGGLGGYITLWENSNGN